MTILKANKYFNLECDAIPDNVIRMVTGHYTVRTYDNVTENYEGFTQVRGLRSSGAAYLPAFTSSQLATDSNIFQDEFLDMRDDFMEDDSGSELYWKQRNESVAATIDVEVSDVEPISFVNATVSSATGLRRDRTTTSGLTWTLGWLTDFSWNHDRIYTIKNYNASGYPSNKTESSYVSCSVVGTQVDSVKDGTRLINGRYVLKVTISVEVFKGYQYCEYEEYWDPESGTTKLRNVRGNLWYMVINSFDIDFTYGKYNVTQESFEVKASASNPEDYPLNIEGNMYTGAETYYQVDNVQTPWYRYISNKLFGAFTDGKLWVKTKVKANWLIENNITINSELYACDIDNMPISVVYNSKAYNILFKVKNIEYVYESNTFYANICLIEYSRVSAYDYVGIIENSQFVRAIISDGTKVMIKNIK